MGNFLGNNDNLRIVDEQGIFTVFKYVEGLVNVYRGTGRILVAPLNGGGLTASGTRHTTQSVNKSQLLR